jgi:hypothetical protein
MLEALSLVFGGALRLVPELMKLWDKQKERAHEKEMFDLQLRADKLRADLAMQSMEKQGEIQQQLAELQALITATQAQANITVTRTGNKIVDGFIGVVEVMSATVRPTITYWLVAAYSLYKLASYDLMVANGAAWQDAVLALWTPHDMALLSSVVSFWFVDRTLRKLKS